MKFKLLVVFAFVLLCVSTAFHEAIHVIQYYLLYGDNIQSISFGSDSLYSVFTKITFISGTESVIDTLSLNAQWLVLEIPAYLFGALVGIFGFNIYFNYLDNRGAVA